MEMVQLPRLVVSAAQKSAGKTTLTLGLLAYFAAKGIVIRSFKKGPDYIDPAWHSLATGLPCYNLDPWLIGSEGCLTALLQRGYCEAARGSLVLIEGNHGLHDGLSLDGSDSTAGLAALTNSPVLLVVDSRHVSRGIAATVLGLQQMPPHSTIRGVVLNRVRTARQAAKQRAAIEHYCGIPVLGELPVDSRMIIAERHLGLTTVAETAGARAFIETVADIVGQSCNMEAIHALFLEAPPLHVGNVVSLSEGCTTLSKPRMVRIGVFRDAAFCFYYPDNLDALERAGGELVFINSLEATSLPEIDGLYLGGGFPESFFEQLSSNNQLLAEVRQAIDGGLPTYAECGGLIYLCQAAIYQGKKYQLAGVLPVTIGFNKKPAGHGYVELESKVDSAWYCKGERFKAHEFHYGYPLEQDGGSLFQFHVLRGHGVTGNSDGFLYKNLFASFAHLHASATTEWAPRFVALARANQQPQRC